MTFSDFSSSAASARGTSAVRLPQPVTASTGCALAFLPLQAADFSSISTKSEPRGIASRRSGRDVHQGSYYAQCRVAMGY